MNINEIIKKEEEQSHKKFLAYIIADMIYIYSYHIAFSHTIMCLVGVVIINL